MSGNTDGLDDQEPGMGVGDEVSSPPLRRHRSADNLTTLAQQSPPRCPMSRSVSGTTTPQPETAGVRHMRIISADIVANDSSVRASFAGPSTRKHWDDPSRTFRDGRFISARRVFHEMDAAGGNGRLKGVALSRHLYFPPPGDADFEDPEAVVAKSKEVLERGGGLFSFSCRPAKELNDEEKRLVDSIANMSSFEDEVADNCVPHFDVYDPALSGKFIIMVNQCAYLLPGMKLSQMTPQLLASYDFQKHAQTASVHVWDDVSEENTFRITKTIIRFVFSITIQFKCSRINERDLALFSRLVGVRVDAGLLMERTKRTDKTKQDATAKAKSVLLYTEVDGGLLVHNLTIVLNSALPTIIARLVNNLGSAGIDEVDETAMMTRNHLRNVFCLK